MTDYRVGVPMRTRYADGSRHENMSFYTIKASSLDFARQEGERQAREYLRQLQVANSIVGWYIYSDKIEVHDANHPILKPKS